VALAGAFVVVVAFGLLAVVRVVVAVRALGAGVVVDGSASALDLAPELHAARSSTAVITVRTAMVNDRL
jgi:hypothetical protein